MSEQKEKIYLVKDMDGLSVMKLNQQQLNDVVARIRNRYMDTPLAPTVLGDLESCLNAGSLKIIDVVYR